MIGAKRIIAGMILSGIFVAAVGCASPEAKTVTPIPSASESAEPPSSTNITDNGQKTESTYALKVRDQLIHLQDWDNNIDLEGMLGKPLSQKTETLKNADTMTGSFLKKLNYKGLYMELFSPKQNGKTFWIMTMKVTTDTFETPNGITVGCKVAALKKAYPGIGFDDGRMNPDNAVYRVSDEEGYHNLEFEVKAGLVTEISLFFLIP
ncbi:MAG: hypothetical protein K6T94_19415 [Paenibacillus sp.]|nr:hypothetical protein [Paenibacillus sp.]